MSKINRNFVKLAINLLLLIISALYSQSKNVMEWVLLLLVNYVAATDEGIRNLYTVFCVLTATVSGQHGQVSVNKGILCGVSVYKLCQVKKKYDHKLQIFIDKSVPLLILRIGTSVSPPGFCRATFGIPREIVQKINNNFEIP